MLKKVIIIFIILNFCMVNSIIGTYVNDNEEYQLDEEVIEEINTINTSVNLEKEPELNSRAAIIYNRDSKEVMWSKNKDEKRKMASTTKIMTAIIVLENCNLKDTITISKKAAGVGGSRLGLKTNDKITINDLLYGLLLVSGNDSAIALAEHTAGSVEEFANMMNNKAKELNLEQTNFVTPHGLDSDEHYTTAYELAKIADYALNNPKFAEIVNTKHYTVNINGYPKSLINTNELLGNLNGVNGVKTGFTNGANRCLVTSVKRNGMNIITIVLGADTKKFRTVDSVKLIEYAYENYKNIKIDDKIKDKYDEWKAEFEDNIVINKGNKKSVNTVLEESDKKYITIKKQEENDISIEVENEEYFETPLAKNQIVGRIKVFVGKEEKMVINILNNEEINRKKIKDFYIELIKNNRKNLLQNI